MKVYTFYFVVLLGLIFLGQVQATYTSDRVLLSDIKSITLHQNKYTNSRRTSPIPQLQCIGTGKQCKKDLLPNVVQCYNMGTDGVAIQWKCDAELNLHVLFDSIDISCEGYYDAQDQYILSGSCGLKYKLKITNENTNKQTHHTIYKSKSNHVMDETEYDHLVLILTLIILLFIAFLIHYLFKNDKRRSSEPLIDRDERSPLPSVSNPTSGFWNRIFINYTPYGYYSNMPWDWGFLHPYVIYTNIMDDKSSTRSSSGYGSSTNR